MREINFYGLKKGAGLRPLRLDQTRKYNNQGVDIYWTFNEFSGFGRRKKEDLRKIWGIYLDIDCDDKTEIVDLISSSSLEPSLVIDSKNGYHVYWYLKEPIDCSAYPEKYCTWYREFIQQRMLHLFNADPQAVDACRLLRPAFYKYWKDGEGKYYTDIVFDNEETTYTVAELEAAFPRKETPRLLKKKMGAHEYKGTNFWDRANEIPAREALELLSGMGVVNKETYEFIDKSDGSVRININGESSNAWLDVNGKIGSTTNAGPSIPNWLNFYLKDWCKVAKAIKENFPEVGK